MESLIGPVKSDSEEKNVVDAELDDFFRKLIEELKTDTDINLNKDTETIALKDKEKKDKIRTIICPRRIRPIIINNNNIFLTNKITNLLKNNNILSNYDFKITEVDNNNKNDDFDEVESSIDDIKYEKKADSSVGGYTIPIVIQSTEDENDFYKLILRLIAKPNDGKTAKREGNLSITICEVIPVLLWNKNASVSISLDEVIELLRSNDYLTDKIPVTNNGQIKSCAGSYSKLNEMYQYFVNKYEDDKDKSIATNKIYGAIEIYKYIKTKLTKEPQFSVYTGKCIWTDSPIIKPDSYKTSPADIMIENPSNDKDWLQISLKTAEYSSQDPPLLNCSINSIFNFLNLRNTKYKYDIKKDVFDDVIAKAREKQWFTDEEITNLLNYCKYGSPNSSRNTAMVNYMKNSEVLDKLMKDGEDSVRSYVADKLMNILVTNFYDDQQALLDYLLQAKNDGNFIIFKAIERKGTEPEVISLKTKINGNLKIFRDKSNIIINNFSINGTPKYVKLCVRPKGNGVHAYFNYDVTTQLKDSKKK